MEWAFERFSLYDFFNLLFSGGLLLLGLQFFGFPLFRTLSTVLGCQTMTSCTCLLCSYSAT